MTIDFSKLPKPDVIEAIDFEAILQARKDRLIELMPDAASVIDNESEPLNILLQEQSYRELILRQRINDSALALTLAYAIGADLDYIGQDRYNTERLIITPADDSTNPPTPAVMESDDAYRERLYRSVDALSTAGPKRMYEAIAMSADGDVADALATSPTDGQVTIFIASHTNNGNASIDLTNIVATACSSDDVRPMTDWVLCSPAPATTTDISAQLTLDDGLDTAGADAVMANAEAALDELKQLRRIGVVLSVSQIHAALHVAGVQSVSLATPSADVDPGDTGIVVIENTNISQASGGGSMFL